MSLVIIKSQKYRFVYSYFRVGFQGSNEIGQPGQCDIALYRRMLMKMVTVHNWNTYGKTLNHKMS